MFAKSLSGTLLALHLLFCVSVTNAADIRNQGLLLVIEGEIEKGDFDRFEALVKEWGKYSNTVMLGSSGGDLVEAMKIGRLIREMRLTTSTTMVMSAVTMDVVGIKDSANSLCSSSCFYIFIAGINRFGNLLGIHRPYLPEETYKSMQIDDAIDASRAVRQLVHDYFKEMGVPVSYIDRSFAVASNDIEWLTAEEVEKFLAGDIPEVDEWVTARCPKFTEAESISWYDRSRSWEHMSSAERALFEQANAKFSQIEDCKSKIRKQMSCRAWYKRYGQTSYDPC